MLNNVITEIKPWNLSTFEDFPSFRYFPYNCRCCAYWESLEFDDKTNIKDAIQIKQNWLIHVSKEFGNCGFIAYLNKRPVGLIQYAPTEYFPRIEKYQDISPSKDSIFLTCLYIPDKRLRGKGIGKQLLNKVIRDLKNRGYRKIGTFVQIHNSYSNNLSDWLTRPLEFFIRMDFKVIKQKCNIAHLLKEF